MSGETSARSSREAVIDGISSFSIVMRGISENGGFGIYHLGGCFDTWERGVI